MDGEMGIEAAPVPADLLEPLHQPDGQSWGDVEQKSLLLQLPQRRCEPAGQDPRWATRATGQRTLPPMKAPHPHCTH